jgi:peptide deformylase
MIIVGNEDLLRVKCEPVLSGEIEHLRKKLEEALIWSGNQGFPGVGLACPQIGIAKSMAIVRIDNETGKTNNSNPMISIDLVNSTILKGYNQFEFDGEGCLSFPGRFEKTLRYEEILIGNNIGTPYGKFIVKGFAAVVCQHEQDHLLGKLLTDVAIN